MNVIAKRVRDLRKQQGWSAQRLASEMTAVGIPWERGIVTKLETGRRQSVSVDEFLALAYVLSVAPVHLLVPIDDDAAVLPVPGLPVSAEEVRAWIRGQHAIGQVDIRRYASDVPEQEFRADYRGMIPALQANEVIDRALDAARVSIAEDRKDDDGR